MCPEKQYLSQFVDRQLTDIQEASVKRHLDACADCRRQVDSYLRVSALFKQVEYCSDEETQEKIYDRITHSTRIVRGSFASRANVLRLAPVAAVLLLAAGMFIGGRFGFFKGFDSRQNSGITVTDADASSSDHKNLENALEEFIKSEIAAEANMDIPLTMDTMDLGESQLVKLNPIESKE